MKAVESGSSMTLILIWQLVRPVFVMGFTSCHRGVEHTNHAHIDAFVGTEDMLIVFIECVNRPFANLMHRAIFLFGDLAFAGDTLLRF
mgnify:CR=1 FL=1